MYSPNGTHLHPLVSFQCRCPHACNSLPSPQQYTPGHKNKSNMIKDMIDKQVLELKKLWANKRQLTFQLLNLAMIVFSALMIWKGLMFATKVGTKSV